MVYTHWQKQHDEPVEEVFAFSHLFAGAIGHTTTFVDPGWKAGKCSKEMIDNLNQTVEKQDPSLIYPTFLSRTLVRTTRVIVD